MKVYNAVVLCVVVLCDFCIGLEQELSDRQRESFKFLQDTADFTQEQYIVAVDDTITRIQYYLILLMDSEEEYSGYSYNEKYSLACMRDLLICTNLFCLSQEGRIGGQASKKQFSVQSYDDLQKRAFLFDKQGF